MLGSDKNTEGGVRANALWPTVCEYSRPRAIANGTDRGDWEMIRAKNAIPHK